MRLHRNSMENPTADQRLWRFLREDGSSGYVVTTAGPEAPKPVAVIAGRTAPALHAALRLVAQGNTAKPRADWRTLIGAVLIPINALGRAIRLSGGTFCYGEYRAAGVDGYFVWGTATLREHLSELKWGSSIGGRKKIEDCGVKA